MAVFRVKTDTEAKKLAGAIQATFQNKIEKVQLSCLGAFAVNQAVKAIIIVSGQLKPIGIELEVNFHFDVVSINDEERTLIIAELSVKK